MIKLMEHANRGRSPGMKDSTMSIRTRIGGGLAASALILAPMIALAPSASAMICPEDDENCNIVIEGEDGYASITTLSGDIGGLLLEVPAPDFVEWFEITHDADGNLVCLNADGTEMDMSVMTDDCQLDRSGLARGDIADLDDIGTVDGPELGGGDGYVGITQIDGEIGIEPIHAEINDGGFPVWAWILIGVGAAGVAGATAVGIIRRSDAAGGATPAA
jgi:hypothetical protein